MFFAGFIAIIKQYGKGGRTVYEEFAQVYDEFMQEVSYSQWAVTFSGYGAILDRSRSSFWILPVEPAV